MAVRVVGAERFFHANSGHALQEYLLEKINIDTVILSFFEFAEKFQVMVNIKKIQNLRFFTDSMDTRHK
jgi:hypothetical protein